MEIPKSTWRQACKIAAGLDSETDLQRRMMMNAHLNVLELRREEFFYLLYSTALYIL